MTQPITPGFMANPVPQSALLGLTLRSPGPRAVSDSERCHSCRGWERALGTEEIWVQIQKLLLQSVKWWVTAQLLQTSASFSCKILPQRVSAKVTGGKKKMHVECLAQSRAGSKQPRNGDVIIISVGAVVYPDGCSWSRTSPVLSLLCPWGLHWPDTQ